MSFQSFPFLAFFIIVMLFCTQVRGKVRHVFILIASLFFYTYGEQWNTLLLVVIILFTYLAGRVLEQHANKKTLTVFVLLTLMPLFFYKYFVSLWSVIFSSSTEIAQPTVAMPIGISFYTFQAISYLVDVYKKRIPAEKSIVYYSLFIAFFPQVLCGPIGRAEKLLPQLKSTELPKYDTIVSGLRLMGVGFIYKSLFADSFSRIVDIAYSNIQETSAIMLIVSVLLYSLQIYADFYGYTTIARGCARTMGIELAQNFNHPYSSLSIGDFWRRWHISLSSWLRDYIYIPLGGNRKGVIRKNINLMVTFIVSGIWHGTGINFIIWGALNGAYQIIEYTLKIPVKLQRKRWGSIVGRVYMFFAITISWIFFRASNVADACTIVSRILMDPVRELWGLLSGKQAFSSVFYTNGLFLWNFAICVGALVMYLIFEYLEKKYKGIDNMVSKWKTWQRWIAYGIVLTIALAFGSFGEAVNEFIYYRF